MHLAASSDGLSAERVCACVFTHSFLLLCSAIHDYYFIPLASKRPYKSFTLNNTDRYDILLYTDTHTLTNASYTAVSTALLNIVNCKYIYAFLINRPENFRDIENIISSIKVVISVKKWENNVVLFSSFAA